MALLIYVVAPFAYIWAINTLFTLNIPINIKILAHTEEQAEQKIFDLFKEIHHQEMDATYNIDEWEFFKFVEEDEDNLS